MVKITQWKIMLLISGLLLSGASSGWLKTAVSSPQPTAYQKQPIDQLLNEFGTGASTIFWGTRSIEKLDFNWMKMYEPPRFRHQINILWRLEVTAQQSDAPNTYADHLRGQVRRYDNYVEAYEIGNEVNLRENGWERTPNAAEYVGLLCRAYHEIKLINPNAIVVSAGLAPVGRIQANWNGHLGHNGNVQDEREYLREFLAAGGANCADVIGYHPIGFRAAFDAEPDVDGGTPGSNCANGFCFRNAEMIHAILQEHGLGNKPVWATEMGWLRTPPSSCLTHPSWEGRAWQTVSPVQQAENLLGAFAYAQENWPWMKAMFIFNYNFQDAIYYDRCEQMRYYGIRNQLAEVWFKQRERPFRQHLPLIPATS